MRDHQVYPEKVDSKPDWQKQLLLELQEASADGGPTEGAVTRSSSSSNKMAGGLAVGISILGIVGLQFPFLFPKSAPYMATPGNKIRRALQFLNDQTATTSRGRTVKSIHRNAAAKTNSIQLIPPNPSISEDRPLTFVDLGSGDGQAVYEAARLGYRAIGIEFNWTLWAFSSLRRRFFWSRNEQDRSTLLRQDFTHYHLREADTIMIFAVPRTMPVLGRKIQAECVPGTTVLAYRFAIPLAQDDMTSGDEGDDKYQLQLKADLIYDQEEMRIYRMKE